MAGILFYFPSERVELDPRKLFAAAGLGDLLDPLDDAPAVCHDLIRSGPDGKTGTLCYWMSEEPGRTPMPLAVATEHQTWHAAKPRDGLEAGRVWFGLTNAMPVRPEDLVRNKPHAGVPLELADKQRWTVPLVRELPQVLDYNEAGQFTMRFNVPRYEAVFDRTFQWVERMCAATREADPHGPPPEIKFNWLDYWDYAAALLSLNYRLNKDLVACLGLLSNQGVFQLPGTAGGLLVPEKKS